MGDWYDDARTKTSDLEAEIESLRAEIERLKQDHEDACKIIQTQGNLLTGVVNALRGKPPQRTAWSHHDAPELARQAVAEIERLLEAIRKHRRDVWGKKPVNNDSDTELYDILDGNDE